MMEKVLEVKYDHDNDKFVIKWHAKGVLKRDFLEDFEADIDRFKEESMEEINKEAQEVAETFNDKEE